MYVYRRKYNSEIVDIMKRNTVPKDNLDLYTYIDGIVYYTMFLWYNLLTSIKFKWILLYRKWIYNEILHSWIIFP